jgi:hypothetical protein
MFERVKFVSAIYLLMKKQKEIDKSSKARVQQERAGQNRYEEIEGIKGEANHDWFEIEDDISRLRTRYLCRIANRLILPIPDRKDDKMWENTTSYPEEKVLTTLGIAEVRSMIRRERKERIEHTALLIAALTGIIGTITGLIAVILK